MFVAVQKMFVIILNFLFQNRNWGKEPKQPQKYENWQFKTETISFYQLPLCIYI